ncbi:RNA polymerase sigma factor [Chitinophaga eiseniae]|uniref:Sigma-70 family RNA polymerase sigma factor n=1 Tax=Chitinophaga eiseniae TaxID=634771 RepID=A0A847SNH0_9BACT|nr:sigma-70 family RNA polymerase sigma factor [Chitinophaga eiseniae]NLR80427.1 sigma-70 family RNA polymerase sigma factor [Chitinophaga eiseniae]
MLRFRQLNVPGVIFFYSLQYQTPTNDTLFFHQPDNERALLNDIANGDERAFSVLFAHYYPLLFSLVQRFSLEDSDVQEALQETFIQVWLNRDRLTDVRNVQGWLLRIATRRCREVLRKMLLQERTALQADLSNEKQVKVTPEHQMQGGELKRLLAEALDRMPEQRRRIYLMSREMGLKPAEIAEQLSLSVSTVKNTLVIALKQIREHLEEAGYALLYIYIFYNIL